MSLVYSAVIKWIYSIYNYSLKCFCDWIKLKWNLHLYFMSNIIKLVNITYYRILNIHLTDPFRLFNLAVCVLCVYYVRWNSLFCSFNYIRHEISWMCKRIPTKTSTFNSKINVLFFFFWCCYYKRDTNEVQIVCDINQPT